MATTTTAEWDGGYSVTYSDIPSGFLTEVQFTFVNKVLNMVVTMTNGARYFYGNVGVMAWAGFAEANAGQGSFGKAYNRAKAQGYLAVKLPA